MMKPIERILVADDFSPSSEEALKATSYLARQVKGKLTVLHVVSQTPFDGHFFGPVNIDLVNQIEKKASEELAARVSLRIKEAGEVAIQVNVGVPFVDIVRYARQQKIQFMVVGSHGKEDLQRILLGSVAENVIRTSECPVWMQRGAFSAPKKILLLTDLSQNARAGFHLGLFLARLFGAAVHLLHVFESSYVPSFAMIDTTEHELKMKEMVKEEFQKWIEEARLSKVELKTELLEGHVKTRLEEVFKRETFDAVVMSTHGRSTFFHKHLGSLTTHVARHAPCSLISVRPDGFRFKEI